MKFGTKPDNDTETHYSLNNHMKPAPKRRWPIVVAIIVGVFLVTCAAAVFWYFQNLEPKSGDSTKQVFSVKEGDTAATIASGLEDKGLIRNKLAFQLALRLSGKAGNIKAGSYKLAASESATEIMTKLESGHVDLVSLQISPGVTLDVVKSQFVKAGFAKGAVDAAFMKYSQGTNKHPLLRDKPADATLEGYVFPDTYQFDLDTGPEVALKQILDVFYDKLQKDNLIAPAQAKGLNIHQLITLASIIEKEVSNPEDQAHVAQVFLKRLSEDMPLGSDVTFIYAAKLLGVEALPNLDSPYNTRIVSGLPPGPIANTRIGAIQAIDNPTKTEDLYFVAGDDGVTYFAKTLPEHEQYVAEHCKLGCQ